MASAEDYEGAASPRASREAEQRALLDEQSPGELRSPRDREMGAATSQSKK